MRRLLLLVMTVIGLASTVGASRAEAAVWSLHASAGEAFSFPASFRVGYDEWEVGVLGPDLLGFVKTFRQANWFAEFGPVFESSSAGFGLSAGMGWQPSLFWGFRFRAEVLAKSVHTGVTGADALVGLSFIF